ncbi:MAG: HAD family hydrolase [Gallionellaceae bacterium]
MTQAAAKPVVAAFDFDGTLTRRDTLFPFLLQVAGHVKLFNKIIYLSPVMAGYALGIIRNDIAKVKVLRSFLANMEMTRVQQFALQYAKQKLPGLLRPEAMQRLAWHKQQGHRCVVVSASLELYLRPWAAEAGFDDVLGSRLEELDNGRTSGRLLGENCFGPEKMRRLETLLGPREGYTLYAYGDSRGDKELLSAADYPFYRSFTKQGRYEK